MTCRSCAATIDDKAIICYRCGASTADPAARRPAPAGAGAAWRWIAAIVVLGLAVVAYLLQR